MPLFDMANATYLRPWLIRTLEPICDADPEVLADYVLALLKHDASEPELRATFVQQLEDFLDKESPAFVEQLFAALRTKSYMPYAPPSPPGVGQKRPAPDDDYERGPLKGPRLSLDSRFSRHGDGSRQDGSWRGGRNGQPSSHRGGPPFSNGHSQNPRPQNDQKRSQEQCRDYHTRGFCPRGSLCPYVHDTEAMEPQAPFSMPGAAALPFMQMMTSAPFGMFPMAQGYDPTQAHMDMSGAQPINAPGPVYQDVTNHGQGQGHANGAGRGRGRGRGRGGFGPSTEHARGFFAGDQASFDEAAAAVDNTPGPRKGENKTLVIEKIPQDSLSLASVNDWFKKYGTVTNVAIDAKGAKALVTFSGPHEAHAAWKSQDAVFNNRFVKVFWHRPLEGKGAVGASQLAASAPLLANMTTQAEKQVDSSMSSAPPAPAPAAKKFDTSAMAARQQLLERLIAEQKTLMSRYSVAQSPEEKKELMTRLREVSAEMQTTTLAAAAAADPQQHEREQLDKELEQDVEMRTDGPDTDGTTTEDLKAKLARLKAEAASLGMDPNAPNAAAPSTYPYRGGYRGRARGARGFRGRGAMPIRSMKLDNRPKKLLIKGISGDAEALETLRTHFNTAGQVDTAEQLPTGEIVIGFFNRTSAEQAMSRPSAISGIGIVDMSWYADASANAPTAISSGPGAAVKAGPDVEGSEDAFMHDRDQEDDREDDGGWEDDDDDRRRRR
ncbi:hypothetical protein BKA62DRAFT_463897 [Auriculariales sp. MPI-PUGE-AT-0066]|nr:hypothetical protein BKA62DRAFT_463897 [Auriculariales sp. MPI-PUGE-AT-0066]